MGHNSADNLTVRPEAISTDYLREACHRRRLQADGIMSRDIIIIIITKYLLSK